MNEIKFNQHYSKLNGIKSGDKARLLAYTDDEKMLTPVFLQYDTDGLYAMSIEDHYNVFFFLHENGKLFTTIRRDNSDNYEKLVKKIGEEFTIIIEGGK